MTHNTREVEEKLVKHLTDRFLGWRLPRDFHPDGGITFKDVYDNGTEQGGRFEPIGTNLFTAQQAEEMFRFLLEHDDGTSIVAEITHHQLQKAREEAVNELLSYLPDSSRYTYAWEECTSEEQDMVKAIRNKYTTPS